MKRSRTDSSQVNLVKTEDDALVVIPVNIDIINLGGVTMHKLLEVSEEDSDALSSGDLLLVAVEGLMSNTGSHDVVNAKRLEMGRCEVRVSELGDRDSALARDELRCDAVGVEDTDLLLGVL